MNRDAILSAVSVGDYALAAALCNDYILALSPGDSGLRELRSLIDTARISVCQARAHGQARLQALREEIGVAAAYSR